MACLARCDRASSISGFLFSLVSRLSEAALSDETEGIPLHLAFLPAFETPVAPVLSLRGLLETLLTVARLSTAPAVPAGTLTFSFQGFYETVIHSRIAVPRRHATPAFRVEILAIWTPNAFPSAIVKRVAFGALIRGRSCQRNRCPKCQSKTSQQNEEWFHF